VLLLSVSGKISVVTYSFSADIRRVVAQSELRHLHEIAAAIAIQTFCRAVTCKNTFKALRKGTVAVQRGFPISFSSTLPVSLFAPLFSMFLIFMFSNHKCRIEKGTYQVAIFMVHFVIANDYSKVPCSQSTVIF
jgi:hypothetical protein